MARRGNHHYTGKDGNRGTNPEHGIPGMAAQRGAPPAAAGGLVTARATHEPATAGRL